jgi:GNAT superfamily N-acetyltransferase
MSGIAARELEIRAATQSDAGQVLYCLAQAFAPYREQYSPTGFADTVLNESTVKARLENMHVLVATSDGGVVGTVGAAMDGDEGHLRGMAVLPEFQGTTVAALLLCAIEDWLRSQGCTRVSLDTTLPLQAAMKFYEKNGYCRSGRVQDFFGMPLIEYGKRLD